MGSFETVKKTASCEKACSLETNRRTGLGNCYTRFLLQCGKFCGFKKEHFLAQDIHLPSQEITRMQLRKLVLPTLLPPGFVQ